MSPIELSTQEIVTTMALTKPNTIFLFRPNRIEIEIKIKDFKPVSSQILTDLELDHIKKKYIY